MWSSSLSDLVDVFLFERWIFTSGIYLERALLRETWVSFVEAMIPIPPDTLSILALVLEIKSKLLTALSFVYPSS